MRELVAKIDFFSGLEDKVLKKVADAAILRHYARDEMIVRQGETGLGMYIISSGRVKVEREEAGTRVQVAELGPGQSFAEMAILDDKPRSAHVIALEDTECVLLTRDSCVKLMHKYPQIPIRAARLLAERLRDANQKLATVPPPGGAAASPAGAAAPTANPAAPPASSSSEPIGTKAGIQDALLKTFQSLYTLKAFTRFSVAVLGCPVEAFATNLIEEIRVGDVKALVLPADELVDLRIAAREPGSFTLHVLLPAQEQPIRFGPVSVRPEDRVRLSLRPPLVSLHHGQRMVAPASLTP
jgi:CRP-like cAMP-binding protein